jgi:hypothetical protein
MALTECIHSDRATLPRCNYFLGMRCPNNLLELQQFLGFCQYYKRFVNQYLDITEPLTNLRKMDVLLKWTEDLQQTF